jgi:hypothetical protein
MTYHARKPRSNTALGDLSSAVGNAVSQLGTIAGIATDPYAQEFVCRIRQVVAVETGSAVPACQRMPLATPSPAGLKKPVLGMRTYVWAEQRKPWSYPVMIGTIIGVPFLLGYLLGKK